MYANPCVVGTGEYPAAWQAVCACAWVWAWDLATFPFAVIITLSLTVDGRNQTSIHQVKIMIWHFCKYFPDFASL